jgi:hypothetical protein
MMPSWSQPVHLTQDQMKLADECGEKIQEESRKSGRKDQHGFRGSLEQ